MPVHRIASVGLILCFNLVLFLLYVPFRLKKPINKKSIFIDTPLLESSTEQTAKYTQSTKLKYTNFFAKSATTNDFIFTLNPEGLCSTKSLRSKVSLLILVFSSVSNIIQRRTIRETWGTSATETNNTGFVRLAFLLGMPSNYSQQLQLRDESRQYSDLIQQKFVDSYQNLTLKSIMLLKWVSKFCPHVHYVLKTDDDMYVNVPNLLKTLMKKTIRSNVMYGALFQKAKPNRNPSSKWYVPKGQYSGDIFPDYLSGTGYVLSRDVLPKLLEASKTLHFLLMEDVFITGLCASQSRVKRYNVRGFAYWRRPATGCAFKDVITGHHVSVKDMKQIWRELQKRPLICHFPRKKEPKYIAINVL